MTSGTDCERQGEGSRLRIPRVAFTLVIAAASPHPLRHIPLRRHSGVWTMTKAKDGRLSRNDEWGGMHGPKSEVMSTDSKREDRIISSSRHLFVDQREEREVEPG